MLTLLSEAVDAVWLLITEPLRRLFADAFYEALTRVEDDRRAEQLDDEEQEQDGELVRCDGAAVHWGSGGIIGADTVNDTADTEEAAPSWMGGYTSDDDTPPR